MALHWDTLHQLSMVLASDPCKEPGQTCLMQVWCSHRRFVGWRRPPRLSDDAYHPSIKWFLCFPTSSEVRWAAFSPPVQLWSTHKISSRVCGSGTYISASKKYSGKRRKGDITFGTVTVSRAYLEVTSSSMGQNILKAKMTLHMETCNDVLLILWTTFLIGIDSCFFNLDCHCSEINILVFSVCTQRNHEFSNFQILFCKFKKFQTSKFPNFIFKFTLNIAPED